MGKGTKFDNSSVPSSKFPNVDQSFVPYLSKSLKSVQSTVRQNVLYLLNEKGQILILPPSQPGYYSVPNLFVTDSSATSQRGLVISYIPDIARCPKGTYKNNTGVWPCYQCETTPNNTVVDFVSSTCQQCTMKEFCPGEFTTPFDQFESIRQNYGHRKISDINVFDDLILYNIFRTDCGINSPFYIIMISLLIVLLLSILIFFLKLVK